LNILSFETSTKNFSLILSKDHKIIAASRIHLNKALSDAIIPAVDRLLKKAKMPISKIDAFAVGLGPGSFTSLRVGVSTVKGFAFACKKPIFGTCSLDLVAMAQATKTDKDIAVIFDAKRNMVYARGYKCTNGKIKPKTPCLLLGIEDFLKHIKNDTLFVGDAVALYQEKIQAYFHARRKEVLFGSEKDAVPNARFLAILAYNEFQKKKKVSQNIKPMYLYPQDCQVRR